MLRVVIDTNVIVSAMLVKGCVPALVLGLALDNKIQFYYSQALMAEYKRVLGRRKFKFRREDVDEILDKIEHTGTEVFPVGTIDFIIRDPADNRILEASQEARADYLVTGNKKHFPFAKFKKTKVVSPREFLENVWVYI